MRVLVWFYCGLFHSFYFPEGIAGKTPQPSKQNNVTGSKNMTFMWHQAGLRSLRVRVTTPVHQSREFGFQQPRGQQGQLLPCLTRAATNPNVVSERLPQNSLAFESFLCQDQSELCSKGCV